MILPESLEAFEQEFGNSTGIWNEGHKVHQYNTQQVRRVYIQTMRAWLNGRDIKVMAQEAEISEKGMKRRLERYRDTFVLWMTGENSTLAVRLRVARVLVKQGANRKFIIRFMRHDFKSLGV